METSKGSLSRRNFIKFAGIAAASFTSVAPLGQALAAPTAIPIANPGRSALKIGVLAPDSALYPALQPHLVQGLQAYFSLNGTDHPEIILENIGVGGDGLRAKAAHLIQEVGVDLLVGVMSPQVAAGLHALLQTTQTYLIVADVGAQAAPLDQSSPYILHNSLNLWQGHWALGAWAAAHLGKSAVVVTSLYDSGFDTLRAFRAHFEQQGGQVLELIVTDSPTAPISMRQVMQQIQAAQPDFVYALYTGNQGAAFWEAWDQSRPVIGSPFDTHPQAAFITALPWSPDLAVAENQAFMRHYGRSADVFALLGYDTAQLIDHALRTVGGADQAAALGYGLGTAAYSSPRGAVQMSLRTQSAAAPLYLAEKRGQAFALRGQLPAIAELAAMLHLNQGLRSGWTNAYLCV